MKDDLVEKVREKLVFREFQPGEKISEEQLAEEFDVSRTPIREALIKLSSEKLVDIFPNRGAYASKISLENMEDILKIRSRLIGLAGKLAAQRVTAEQISEMKTIIGRMEDVEEPIELVRLDWDFHQVVNRATQSEFLTDMLATLRNHAIQIRLFPEQFTFYRSFVGDFSDLVESLEKNDAKSSEVILVNHVNKFAEEVSTRLTPEQMKGTPFREKEHRSSKHHSLDTQ